MTKILLNFNNLSTRDANQLAAELQDYLLAKADTEVEIQKAKDNTQDFGATLAIILGTGSAVTIARGISNWIRKRSEVSITIKTELGEVVANNLTSKDVPNVLETSLKRLAPNAD